MARGRRQARTVALQALYELDVTSHTPEYAVGCRIKETPLPQAGISFAFELVEGVVDNVQQVDSLVGELAPEWPVEQIASIDRNILRIAMFELLSDVGTPPKVAINEAVELAKRFGTADSRAFVNGIVDRMARQLKRLPESQRG